MEKIELTEFEKNMLEIENINIENNPNLAIERIKEYEKYALFACITDLQFLMLKYYLYSLQFGIPDKRPRIPTDEKVYSQAMYEKRYNKHYKSVYLPHKIEYITEEDKRREALDVAFIIEAQKQGLLINEQDPWKMWTGPKSVDGNYSNNLKSIIENVNFMGKLNKLGLQEYTQKIISKYIPNDKLEEYIDTILKTPPEERIFALYIESKPKFNIKELSSLILRKRKIK